MQKAHKICTLLRSAFVEVRKNRKEELIVYLQEVKVFLDRGERLEAAKKMRVGAEQIGGAQGNMLHIRQVEPFYKIHLQVVFEVK